MNANAKKDFLLEIFDQLKIRENHICPILSNIQIESIADKYNVNPWETLKNYLNYSAKPLFRKFKNGYVFLSHEGRYSNSILAEFEIKKDIEYIHMLNLKSVI